MIDKWGKTTRTWKEDNHKVARAVLWSTQGHSEAQVNIRLVWVTPFFSLFTFITFSLLTAFSRRWPVKVSHHQHFYLNSSLLPHAKYNYLGSTGSHEIKSLKFLRFNFLSLQSNKLCSQIFQKEALILNRYLSLNSVCCNILSMNNSI